VAVVADAGRLPCRLPAKLVVFEWIGTADGTRFRGIIRLVKQPASRRDRVLRLTRPGDNHDPLPL